MNRICHVFTFISAILLFTGCGTAESNPQPAESSPSPALTETNTASGANPAAKPAANPSAATVEFVAPPLSDDEIRQGWISLFDGRSLFGWEVPDVSNWHVEDGTIVADSGEKSLLLTPFDLDDFELRCSFHVAAGGNSGIFLRTALNASNPATDTYELNICDSHPEYRTGSFVGRMVAENVPAVEGAWHDFRVMCEGPRIQVWLDENQIVDFTETIGVLRLTGRLGLQMNEGRAAFRNVCVRPLKFRPMFNGTDTTGWRVVPGSKSVFSVNDGLLHVANGPGFLETTETFDNFALKVEARINGNGLNSGVFFRSKEGTVDAPSHGYELQLHNGFRNGDRSQPVDSGTGAIFRRAPARYVVASDHEFLTAVLIAQQDRFATWVNGFQVVDWRDTRPPSDNPREGLRTEAGHFSLQGHDPTTDLDFRSVDVHAFRNSNDSAPAP